MSSEMCRLQHVFAAPRRLGPTNRYSIKFSLSNRVIYFPVSSSRHVRDPLTLGRRARIVIFHLPRFVLASSHHLRYEFFLSKI